MLTEIRHFHLFCGLGGAARGFNRGAARAGGLEGRFRCVGGVDVDPASVRDFERLAGAPGTVLDLFSREGYRAFHGGEPPEGWREATAEDLRRAAGGERPHVVYASPPCKGFSGLIPEGRAGGGRYLALNELSFRGIWLALEAWADDPPEFFVVENVPRMLQRGAKWLEQIETLLGHYGYSVAPAESRIFDLGELGGLAQRRRRLQLVARHREKVPPMLYQPERRPLRAVGQVLGGLPVPGTPLALPAGPMHRLPRLQWRTWVRLALVEAGGDWRSLQRLEVRDGVVAGVAIVPGAAWHRGALGVQEWSEPAGTVTGNGRPAAGSFAVADPRAVAGWGGKGKHSVTGWADQAGSVIAASTTGTGAAAIADPRPSWNSAYQQLGVLPWDVPAGTVTGQAAVGGGAHAVADPRPGCSPNAHRNKWRVGEWAAPAGSVIGATRPGSGAGCIADPRIHGRKALNNVFRVVAWEEASQAITAGAGPTAGGQAVADPRPGLAGRWVAGGASGPFGVVLWGETAASVTGSACHDNGRWSVADPRASEIFEGQREFEHEIPSAKDRLEALIIALDGTWHRPFTTLELAALQGLVEPGEWLELDGTADTAWRERIGNAVPPPAAAAVASVIGSALLASWSGMYLQMAHTEPWCAPWVIAASVDLPEVTG